MAARKKRAERKEGTRRRCHDEREAWSLPTSLMTRISPASGPTPACVGRHPSAVPACGRCEHTLWLADCLSRPNSQSIYAKRHERERAADEIVGRPMTPLHAGAPLRGNCQTATRAAFQALRHADLRLLRLEQARSRAPALAEHHAQRMAAPRRPTRLDRLARRHGRAHCRSATKRWLAAMVGRVRRERGAVCALVYKCFDERRLQRARPPRAAGTLQPHARAPPK